jgi:hypothetical protein
MGFFSKLFGLEPTKEESFHNKMAEEHNRRLDLMREMMTRMDSPDYVPWGAPRDPSQETMSEFVDAWSGFLNGSRRRF